MKKMNDHFSKIAPQYKSLRTTDAEPILYIEEKLKTAGKIRAADVGCGAGRYVHQLFQKLEDRLFLYCIDANISMLSTIQEFLWANTIHAFKTVHALAQKLPLKSRSLDCVFTFNAIHHFDVDGFLYECSRLLTEDGYVFIYTRLRSQNRRNIWGRMFPGFAEKEKRLYELDEFSNILKAFPQLFLEEIRFFTYERKEPMQAVVEKARNHHYSTFALYSNEEFNNALTGFIENLKREFGDGDPVSWQDENTMLVLRKRTRP